MKQWSHKGAEWAYDDLGSGRPIVLVHGFPLDRRLWAGIVGELATHHRVIAVDLPGFGQSTLGQGFTISSVADDLAAMAESLNLGPIVAAGLSMGGYICEALADQHPEILTGLILVNTKAEADNPQQKDGRNKMLELARTKGSRAVADEMLGKMLSPTTIRQSPQIVRDLRAMMEAVLVKTLETALIALRDRSEYATLLPKLKLPVQIIAGADDVIAPPAIAEAMHQSAAGSKLTIIPDAGHLSPLEQPKLVADAFKAFLA